MLCFFLKTYQLQQKKLDICNNRQLWCYKGLESIYKTLYINTVIRIILEKYMEMLKVSSKNNIV